MSELESAQIALFVLSAFFVAGGFILGLKKQTSASIAMISLSALIAVVAGTGPRSIVQIRSDKGGFEVRLRATPQELEESLAIAEEKPKLPEDQIEEVTQNRRCAVYGLGGLRKASYQANDLLDVGVQVQTLLHQGPRTLAHA